MSHICSICECGAKQTLMDVHRSNSVGDEHAQQGSIPTELPHEGRKEKCPGDGTCDANRTSQGDKYQEFPELRST